MPHYRYRATDATGTVVKASADSRTSRAPRRACCQNLDVTSIKEQKRLSDFEIGKRRVPPMEIMQFSRQMATFVRAGISIPEGLDVIIESTSSKRFQVDPARGQRSDRARRSVLGRARRTREPAAAVLHRTLSRGELTGRIDTVLEQLAELHRARPRRRVRR